MSASLRLQIPTPCHENWEKMGPNEKGRHCMSCRKTVVDLTTMGDKEVVRYMKEAGGHVCGRLKAEQMGREPLLSAGKPVGTCGEEVTKGETLIMGTVGKLISDTVNVPIIGHGGITGVGDDDLLAPPVDMTKVDTPVTRYARETLFISPGRRRLASIR